MASSDVTFFVPGLPASVGDEDLRTAFEKYGSVLKCEVKTERGKLDKKFGYVTMASGENRDEICTDLHEIKDVQVRALLTKDSLHSPDVKKVHLGKLGSHITAEAIREAFSQFGAVLDVHTPKDRHSGARMNYGFVTFGSEESFEAALAAGTVQVEDCLVETKPSAQSEGKAVKGKGKGHDEPDGGILRDRKGGFKYFVPGLPESVTDEDLNKHFSKYGHVIDAAIVTEKGTEKSRGFGYVTMRDSDSRDPLLNDTHLLGGKEINVLLTKDSLTGNVKKIHLGNLREDIQADAIREVFSQFGQVLDVHTPKDAKSLKRQNFGFVTFANDSAFKAALSAGTVEVEGCAVKVKPAAQSQDDGGKGFGKGCGKFGMMEGWGMYGDGFGGKGKGWGKDAWGGDAWGPADPWGGKGWGKDAWGPFGGGKDAWGKGFGKEGGFGMDAWGGKGGFGGFGMGGKGHAWGAKGGPMRASPFVLRAGKPSCGYDF